MGLFGSKKDKDEYDFIYDNGDDRGFDYSDLDENEDPEDVIDSLRGTIESGDCMLCGAKNAMRFDTICFICSECGESVHEDLYYRWAAGYPIESDDEDYEDIY